MHRYHGMAKIQALRWQTGTIIQGSLLQSAFLRWLKWEVECNKRTTEVLLRCYSLCQREVQFFNQYDQLVTNYMTDFELDLPVVRSCIGLLCCSAC